MPLWGKNKEEPNRTDLAKREEERFLLSNLKRGTEIGEFIAVCRTDYVQSYSDQWITRFDYQWTEYLLLVKSLLEKPGDLSVIVYQPQDLSEVYYVVVPPQSPNYSHLTHLGIADYELSRGYEAAVDQTLSRDYGALSKRSVYHSVEPQGAWEMIFDAVMTGQMQSVAVEYNGVKYIYEIPKEKKEAEASAFTALATRHGAYPMEESLRRDQKFDIVPSIPDGITGRVTVREFVANPRSNAPFLRISFQKTEIPSGSVPEGQPSSMSNISFGNELGPDETLTNYLSIKYVQLDYKNPVVKFLGQF